MLKYKPLKGKNIGVVFGTFAPMHVGHVDVITKAKRENDGVIVVCSGYDGDRGSKIGLTLSKRFRYTREVFGDDELVVVSQLDETGIPTIPNGWKEWTERLKEIVEGHSEQGANITFYVGEYEYVKQLYKHYPSAEVSLVSRGIIDISATDIRNNPRKYWHYITKPFKRHFMKKVLVVGSASGGKTTLVKDLARLYNGLYSLEFSRSYQNENNVRDEELTVTDYARLYEGQFKQTADVIDSGMGSGIVFADTNSTVTKVYVEHYLKDVISQEDYDSLESQYRRIQSQEDWDLILVTLPRNDYTDDGFRDMSMSDQKTRDEFTEKLLELLKPFGDKVHVLDGENWGKTYYDCNYQQAKLLINTLVVSNINDF